MQRHGEVVIQMLPNVQQVTIKPVITGTIETGTPIYLGFFEFVHNVRKRGRALLPALLSVLLAP